MNKACDYCHNRFMMRAGQNECPKCHKRTYLAPSEMTKGQFGNTLRKIGRSFGPK